MKVKQTSKVETLVQWIVTVTMDQEEFDDLVSLLNTVASGGIDDVSNQAYELKQRLTAGAPEPDGLKRPVTELKRKAFAAKEGK